MKTKNQKKFMASVIVAVILIASAAVTTNYVVLIAALVPVGLVAVYGNRIDKDNSRKSNNENNESHE